MRIRTRARTTRTLPGIVWAAAWVSFFADVSTEMIYGVLPAFYLGTLSLSILSLGVIEGLAESLVSVTKLFSGALSDRTGRRKRWMLVGYSVSAAAKPLLVAASSGFGVGALRSVDRFGKGVRGAPRDALVASRVRADDRGRAFGVIRALDHGGALTGGLIAAGALAAGLLTPGRLFVFSVIPGAIAVLVVAIFIHEPRDDGEKQEDRPPFSPRAAWRSAGPGLKRYLIPAGVFALANSSDMLLLALCYERFMDAGMAPRSALGQLPLLWALLHVVRSAGSAWGGALSDRVGRVVLLRWSWVIYSGVYLFAALFALGAAPALAWPLFLVYGVSTALMEAPERALISDLEPAAGRRGTAYGLVHFVQGLLALPATALAGVLWLRFGAEWAFGVDAALALVATVILGRVVPSDRVRTPARPPG